MKRVGKPVFFIVFLLIVALTVTSITGVKTYYGDTETTYVKSMMDIRWGIDIRGGVDVTFSAPEGYNASRTEMDAAKAIIETRLVSGNITDYECYADYNSHRIIVRFPWKSDETDFDAAQAIEELGETANLTFREGYEVDESTGAWTGVTESNVILEGKNVIKAEAGVIQDQSTGAMKHVVNLEFDNEGKDKFATATQSLVGKSISIWMDETVLSAPGVNNAITDGKCYIEGSFTAESAKELADKIQAGALPFKLDVSSYGSINPILGESARDSMALAGLIAMILVSLFMIFYYRLPGVVAAISLVGTIVATVACVSGYFGFIPSFTLTLPGIAGIVLTVGMAVDANVITAERIKEEINLGKTIDGAIDAGNENSFSSIFDGNVTQIIVSVVLMGVFGPPDSIAATILKPFLFMFGPSTTGSMYSFGYTLLIGVIFNFVMGVTASRLMLKSLSRFRFFRKPWLYGGASK